MPQERITSASIKRSVYYVKTPAALGKAGPKVTSGNILNLSVGGRLYGYRALQVRANQLPPITAGNSCVRTCVLLDSYSHNTPILTSSRAGWPLLLLGQLVMMGRPAVPGTPGLRLGGDRSVGRRPARS